MGRCFMAGTRSYGSPFPWGPVQNDHCGGRRRKRGSSQRKERQRSQRLHLLRRPSASGGCLTLFLGYGFVGFSSPLLFFYLFRPSPQPYPFIILLPPHHLA